METNGQQQTNIPIVRSERHDARLLLMNTVWFVCRHLFGRCRVLAVEVGVVVCACVKELMYVSLEIVAGVLVLLNDSAVGSSAAEMLSCQHSEKKTEGSHLPSEVTIARIVTQFCYCGPVCISLYDFLFSIYLSVFYISIYVKCCPQIGARAADLPSFIRIEASDVLADGSVISCPDE